MTVGDEVQRFYCIPADLEAMIAGNLRSGGIDPSACEIKRVAENRFEVSVPAGRAQMQTEQGCLSKKILQAEAVYASIERLHEGSLLYQRTGCTHTIGIYGEGHVVAEDVSRHCAIDKAIGLAMRNGIELWESHMVTSCRQTRSTIGKAVACQIPIVISIGAPTDLAIRAADEAGTTLIGFASSERFNVYTHGWRIRS